MISRRSLILGSAAALAAAAAAVTPGRLSFGWTYRTGGMQFAPADLSRPFPVPMEWQVLREPADERSPEGVLALFENIARMMDIEVVDHSAAAPST